MQFQRISQNQPLKVSNNFLCCNWKVYESMVQWLFGNIQVKDEMNWKDFGVVGKNNNWTNNPTVTSVRCADHWTTRVLTLLNRVA